MQKSRRAEELNLSGEEMAFYDAVASNFMTIYDQALLRDLMHEVVITLKKNLKVDWNEPHRDDVKSAIRASVKRVLRRRKIREEDLEPFLGSILVQAQVLYADWPVQMSVY